jgi:hypothetical protein
MNSTEENFEQLAGAFFDEVLVPLSSAADQPYFARGPGGDSKTYFEAPTERKMTAAAFEFPGGGTPSGLIEALESHWAEEGEFALAAAAARLEPIAHALAEANRAQSGDVDIFCYTLF